LTPVARKDAPTCIAGIVTHVENDFLASARGKAENVRRARGRERGRGDVAICRHRRGACEIEQAETIGPRAALHPDLIVARLGQIDERIGIILETVGVIESAIRRDAPRRTEQRPALVRGGRQTVEIDPGGASNGKAVKIDFIRRAQRVADRRAKREDGARSPVRRRRVAGAADLEHIVDRRAFPHPSFEHQDIGAVIVKAKRNRIIELARGCNEAAERII